MQCFIPKHTTFLSMAHQNCIALALRTRNDVSHFVAAGAAAGDAAGIAAGAAAGDAAGSAAGDAAGALRLLFNRS